MRRREFLGVMGGVASMPLTAHAQQPTMPVVGVLSSSPVNPTFLTAVRQGLSEAGYVAGKNIAIEYLTAHGQNDQLPMLAADLVRRQVAVIVASGNPAT